MVFIYSVVRFPSNGPVSNKPKNQTKSITEQKNNTYTFLSLFFSLNVRTVVHYGQEVKSKLFQAYDHGKENQDYYGQDTPPEYRIDVITAPIATYWSLNDWLADPAVSISQFGHH